MLNFTCPNHLRQVQLQQHGLLVHLLWIHKKCYLYRQSKRSHKFYQMYRWPKLLQHHYEHKALHGLGKYPWKNQYGEFRIVGMPVSDNKMYSWNLKCILRNKLIFFSMYIVNPISDNIRIIKLQQDRTNLDLKNQKMLKSQNKYSFENFYAFMDGATEIWWYWGDRRPPKMI